MFLSIQSVSSSKSVAFSSGSIVATHSYRAFGAKSSLRKSSLKEYGVSLVVVVAVASEGYCPNINGNNIKTQHAGNLFKRDRLVNQEIKHSDAYSV